ncbi:hypothetical protein U5922_011150 [Aquicoccus sp. G2-2]|uniref:hypothetical protein n=1 Tax=Aquicoccus sp. G2-2 TaxID=3092120 RepID=UPI002ADF92AA|nr:hypothetical protein [Aquicoccus sp. G2-2]MEA1113991.1 hypothetical protein [Aquicoccus sp. G2-2]
MRLLLGLMALAALAACNTTVPDSGAGVGFGDYDSYQREKAAREAALSQQATPAPGQTASSAAGTEPQSAMNPAASGSDVAKETAEMLARTEANSGEVPLDASPSNPPPVRLNNPGISDENSFEAVGERRTIKDDAALRRAQQAQYEQIQPAALPPRTGSAGPSIVEFALSTTNPRGKSMYRRSGLASQARAERKCAKYPSPDLAQIEFLKKGGPDKDRLGLDPDGDGYACTWDPSPFREAAKNG